MATNENGNLLDTAGNVAVDFVWGNFPLQPNDVREENGGELLDADLDNHSIAYEGWNGYPLYTPNTAGAEGAGYIVVPSVIGETTAVATNVLEDAGLVVTAATAATNAAKVVTDIARTEGETDTVYTTSAAHGYSAGQKVTVSNTGTAALNGVKVIDSVTTDTFTVTASVTTVVEVADITGAVVAVAGTIKTQSVAAGANEIEVGDAITITPWAAAS
jgi:hypothetical protein